MPAVVDQKYPLLPKGPLGSPGHWAFEQDISLLGGPLGSVRECRERTGVTERPPRVRSRLARRRRRAATYGAGRRADCRASPSAPGDVGAASPFKSREKMTALRVRTWASAWIAPGSIECALGSR
jgi:hypothetical protein